MSTTKRKKNDLFLLNIIFSRKLKILLNSFLTNKRPQNMYFEKDKVR